MMFYFSGLFENRHGWTVQLHDDSGVYELAGSDYVLDLIGETEVPNGSSANVAPFLVSASKAGEKDINSDAKADKNGNHVHRADIDRVAVVEKYEAPPPLPVNDLATNIANIKENLRFVAKSRALATYSQEMDEGGPTIPPPPPVAPPPGSIPAPPPPPPPPHARAITELTSRLQGKISQNQSGGDNGARQSKLNQRPFDAIVPGMSKTSVLNKRLYTCM